MKVYRILTEQELNNLLAENYAEIGSYYNNKSYKPSNNHHYKKDIKYMHFFKHKSSLSYMEQYLNKAYQYFICCFDIPYSVLIKGIGKGNYELSGMDYLTISQREYIVPSKCMKKEWLVSYIKHKDSTCENLIR